MLKKITLILICFLLQACVTPQSNTYLLSYPEPNTGNDNSKIVVLLPIKISDFLDHKGIAIQDDQSLQFSSLNLWAGGLSSQINLSALKTLSSLNNYPVIKKENLYQNANSNTFTVAIEIDTFNAIQPNFVKISGSYWFYNKNKKITKLNSFSKTKLIQDTGYDSIVKNLNELWQNTLIDINNDLTKSLN